jgi:uncharacterized protein YndB with AHSA1/START domain/uncharacterized protein YciI
VAVAATLDRVFHALTSPQEIVRWWGSDEVYRIEAWVADLIVGGPWRADGRMADGSAFSVAGELVAIDPPRKLVQTWKADWDEGPPTVVTYWLEATDEGTRVTLRHEGFDGTSESWRSYLGGWRLVLQWLERHFGPQESRTPPRFFLLRLNPPRPTFPKDMSPQEGAVIQEHFAYWAKLAQEGTAVVYGPVDDPQGTWGLAVVRVAHAEAIKALEADDPVIRSALGFRYDVSPMFQALVSE